MQSAVCARRAWVFVITGYQDAKDYRESWLLRPVCSGIGSYVLGVLRKCMYCTDDTLEATLDDGSLGNVILETQRAFTSLVPRMWNLFVGSRTCTGIGIWRAGEIRKSCTRHIHVRRM